MNNTSSLLEKNELLAALDKYRLENSLPLFLYLGIMLIIGSVGNSLVIFVNVTKGSRNKLKIFIVTLSIYDVFTACVCIPGDFLHIIYLFSYSSEILCKFVLYSSFVSVVGSFFVLVVISFERYRQICKPHDKMLNNKQTIIILMVTTLFAMALCSPIWLFGGIRIQPIADSGLKASTCELYNDEYKDSVIATVSIITQNIVFFVGCFMLIFFYVRVFITLYRNEQKLKISVKESSCPTNRNQPSHLPTTHNFRHKKPVTLLTVTIVFLISYVPFLVIEALEILGIYSYHKLKVSIQSLGSQVIAIVYRSFFIQSVANPFIYSFFNTIFRNEMKKILCPRLNRIASS